jgi:sterol desaturase/sphingolipid hydroxylase (fatty acid hydroxylase superfamily)
VTTDRLITGAVIAIVFGVMLFCESLRPLRQSREPKLRRMARNLANAGLSLAAMTLLQAPLLTPVSHWTMAHRAGLLNLVTWPRWLELALAIVLLDYTLWWWHWASHRVPFLWRFHLPHHVDRDLDTSTALRFHFGELSLSIVYRAVQIVVIGTDPFVVWVWQTILFASILFHHSNARLPRPFEQWLVRFIVTPRMHGIHHSQCLNETSSNWSSLLSCWDYLHRTLLLNVPQRDITIGVPAYQRPEDVTIGRVLALPFVPQRDDWRLPDGSLAARAHDDTNRRHLGD